MNGLKRGAAVLLALLPCAVIFGKHASCHDTVRLPAAERKRLVASVPEFEGVPHADRCGIILRRSTITIPGSPYAYNPSIIPHGEGYLLAYRHEYWKRGAEKTAANKKSVLGLIRLDDHLKTVGGPKYLRSKNHHSEDPRLLSFQGVPHVFYTKYTTASMYMSRMALGRLNERSLTMDEIMPIDYAKGQQEKNWTPFVYPTTDGRQELYFLYSFVPHDLLRFSPSHPDGVERAFAPLETPHVLRWQERWGVLRGGTPAVFVDGEYLAFFHSSFRSLGHKWYVVGAATFEPHPPFRMTKISKWPLLFSKMYAAPVARVAADYPSTAVHVTFPGGFAEGRENGRAVLYLVYGENDSAIGLLTIDKQRLISSLEPVGGR